MSIASGILVDGSNVNKAALRQYLEAREIISVKDTLYGALGNGSADDTAALQAAFTAAKAVTDREAAVLIPAGDYRVTTLDMRGMTNVTLILLGAVYITGTQNGGSKIINLDGGTGVTYTRRLRTLGLLQVQCAAGVSYVDGIKAASLVGCNLNLSVSGSFTGACVDWDYSWENESMLIMANTNDGAGGTVYCLKENGGGMNDNHYLVRATGSSNLAHNQVGLLIRGVNQGVVGTIQGLATGLNYSGAKGCTFRPYFELVLVNVRADSAGIAYGNTFSAGFYDISSNGTGFIFGNAINTTVIGGYMQGESGGSPTPVNRTAFNYGAVSYNTQIIGLYPVNVDTIETGRNQVSLGSAGIGRFGPYAHDLNNGIATIGSDATTSDGREILRVINNNLASPNADTGTRFYEALGTGYNSAAAAQKICKNSTTSRSINAAGSLNASGADYAEYMTKAEGCGAIAKGAICGVDASGRLTDRWADAIAFVVKSTNPSYVGGDAWGTTEHIGPEPESPPEPRALPQYPAGAELTPEQRFELDELVYARQAYDMRLEEHRRQHAKWTRRYEAARARVDRIAFAGIVPVNVTRFTAGDYIVPVQAGAAIAGAAVAAAVITFEEYRRCVGRVWASEGASGRALIAVKVG